MMEDIAILYKIGRELMVLVTTSRKARGFLHIALPHLLAYRRRRGPGRTITVNVPYLDPFSSLRITPPFLFLL